MTRGDSRAQRFVKIWLGPSLATLVGIGSTVELTAMPIPAAGVQLPGPTLIQQSPGPHGDAQEPAGTARPPSADESKRDSFMELHQALTAAGERLEQQLSRAAEAVAATGQLQQELAALREENQKLRAEIEAVRAERSDLETAKQAVEAHAAELIKTVEEATDERDDLRARLADATARLGWSEAAQAQLESEVAELREAAGTAADDARQNLIAVENRIKELIDSLAAIGLAAGPLETDAALLAESGTRFAGEQADDEGRAAAAPVGNVAAVAAPSQRPEPGNVDADLQRTETASVTRPGDGEDAHLDQRGILGGRPAVFPTLADLPPEKRQHVQSLLAYVPSKLEERGLMTTVPGEVLFAGGSAEVQPGAYDTLAKVAELIGMYNDRQVLIIGHSDARGDAVRNKELSERRAERVKDILVNYFEIAPDRLSTEGLGDTLPIASNATPQGRRANRRVEVLILN
jgi:outer membrane protein OmpA-like peptidoglycan-associated protein